MLSIWETFATGAGLLAGIVLCGFLAANLRQPDGGFWPAEGGGWREILGLGLFRILCAAIVVTGVLALIFEGGAPLGWLVMGAVICAGAFFITLRCYGFLGRDNTYFKPVGLVTDGIYAYTRNPQYVFSVLSSLGLALAAWSVPALLLSMLLALVYTLFALNEERWLIGCYGDAFTVYMRQTPRFLGLRSMRRLAGGSALTFETQANGSSNSSR